MPLIETNSLEAGMILGDDLKTCEGRFLLGKGSKLENKHLKVIKTWGIPEVEIEGAVQGELNAQKTSQIDPQVLQIAEETTRQRFVHTDLAIDGVRALFDICVSKKAKDLSENNLGNDQEKGDTKTEAKGEYTHKKDVKSHIQLESLVMKNLKLPTLPIVYHRINDTINDPRSSASDFAAVIEKDPSLSAMLLKLVNSAFYGFPSKIETVSRAITIIGTRELSTLALGTSAMKMFKDIPSSLINMKSFWKHSISCGIIARIIAGYKKLNMSTERFFLAGLLHDMGKLVVFQNLPDISKGILSEVKQANTLQYKTERKTLGFDHCEIGGMLVKKWNFPLALENAVGAHHPSPNENASWEAALVHVSDVIANAMGIGTSGQRSVPSMEATAWDTLGISAGTLRAVVQEAEPRIADTVQTFFPNE
jgi:HD-like signal output (HDOD) protein